MYTEVNSSPVSSHPMCRCSTEYKEPEVTHAEKSENVELAEHLAGLQCSTRLGRWFVRWLARRGYTVLRTERYVNQITGLVEQCTVARTKLEYRTELLSMYERVLMGMDILTKLH